MTYKKKIYVNDNIVLVFECKFIICIKMFIYSLQMSKRLRNLLAMYF